MFDLARLIHPVDPATFEREYWEQKPLVVARNDPRYYHDLLSLADVDRIRICSEVGRSGRLPGWTPRSICITPAARS
jgi:ribosomal protein L16 Arg81 hydroxylase